MEDIYESRQSEGLAWPKSTEKQYQSAEMAGTNIEQRLYFDFYSFRLMMPEVTEAVEVVPSWQVWYVPFTNGSNIFYSLQDQATNCNGGYALLHFLHKLLWWTVYSFQQHEADNTLKMGLTHTSTTTSFITARNVFIFSTCMFQIFISRHSTRNIYRNT